MNCYEPLSMAKYLHDIWYSLVICDDVCLFPASLYAGIGWHKFTTVPDTKLAALQTDFVRIYLLHRQVCVLEGWVSQAILSVECLCWTWLNRIINQRKWEEKCEFWCKEMRRGIRDELHSWPRPTFQGEQGYTFVGSYGYKLHTFCCSLVVAGCSDEAELLHPDVTWRGPAWCLELEFVQPAAKLLWRPVKNQPGWCIQGSQTKQIIDKYRKQNKSTTNHTE